MEKRVVFIFLVMILTVLVNAATIYVPGTYSTIQEGIDASDDGDEVIVSPGTYTENINFLGKSIVVGSLFYTTQDPVYVEQTIIDGGQNGSVVTFASEEDSTSIISGFTITNGHAEDAEGGGVYINNASPVLDHLDILDNSATSNGGGIYCISSNLILEGVSIIENSAWYGGGIYCIDSNLNSTDLLISNNTAGYNGGGICSESSNAEFENVTIAFNTGGYNGGGGIYSNESSMSFEDVIFSSNSVNDFGGGICFISSNAELLAVTFVGNTVDDNGGGIYFNNSIASLDSVSFTNNSTDERGGGIYLCNNSNLDLVDVTITENSSYMQGGGIFLGESSELSTSNVTISNNSASNGGGIYCSYSEPVLGNVIISDNSANYNGGGIYCNHADLIIENVIVSNNTSEQNGGGIYYNFCSPELINATISENSAGYWGGGIFNNHSSPGFENVIIMNNSAGYSGGGMMYENSSTNEYVRGLIISGNQADFNGGGVYCDGSSPVFTNTTITNNEAAYEGDGLYCYTAHPIVLNSIVWNNLPQNIAFSNASYNNSIVIAYSDIDEGEEGIITNDNGTINWLEGNIDADPLFADTQADDYSLSEDSPCIDAGTDYFEYEGEALIDMNANEYSGAAPDMGAFEFDMMHYGDIDDNGMVESYDASLILMYVVGLDPLPEVDPLPWEDWRIERADINLSGDIGAIDAGYVLQYVAGIINGFPVINNVRSAAGKISITHDRDFIYFNSQSKIFSLECEITYPENMTTGLPDVLSDDVMYCNNDNKFALISAYGISGNIVKISYQVECTRDGSIHFKIKDNGNFYEVEYTFEEQVPEQCGLISVYPNPFNPETDISYNLPETGHVKLSVYNIKGQLVKILVDEDMPARENSIVWSGNKESSGIYMIKLVSEKSITCKKVMLLK